ncbi:MULTISPECIES: SRPBCC family protein [Gordonia]|uniref:Polyketide cyclase/dehydrase n=1 Tax=Gordonia terrae C-6 TaxID=1316928 RepID=R7Y5T2_9ACTN|nr:MULTISPECIES: SRPBCC family protein [Gordonia]AFR46786.1 polyketide cyclase/dehydrase [Gordonia sp. KTR9]EON31381.1 polyketide cyclase/dehydrase [Gordonia terrae C-6]
MVEVSRTFPVRQPIETVVAYMRDFANAVEWDPGTQKCEQIGTDPIALGTRWHNETKLYGISTTLTYELTRDDPDHVVFTGRNKTATSVDDLSFAPDGPTRTSFTYRSHITFNGRARLADPLAQLAFNRLAGSVEDQITRVLNRL